MRDIESSQRKRKDKGDKIMKIRKMKKITSYVYGRKDVYFVDMDDEVFIRWNEEDDEVGELCYLYYDNTGWLNEVYLGPASSFKEETIMVKERI